VGTLNANLFSVACTDQYARIELATGAGARFLAAITFPTNFVSPR